MSLSQMFFNVDGRLDRGEFGMGMVGFFGLAGVTAALGKIILSPAQADARTLWVCAFLAALSLSIWVFNALVAKRLQDMGMSLWHTAWIINLTFVVGLMLAEGMFWRLAAFGYMPIGMIPLHIFALPFLLFSPVSLLGWLLFTPGMPQPASAYSGLRSSPEPILAPVTAA